MGRLEHDLLTGITIQAAWLAATLQTMTKLINYKSTGNKITVSARRTRGIPFFFYLIPASMLLASSAHATYIYGISDNNKIYEVSPDMGTTRMVLDLSATLTTSQGSNAFAYDTSHDFMFFRYNTSLYYWNHGSVVGNLGSISSGGFTAAANAAFYNGSYYWFQEGTTGSTLLYDAPITYNASGLPVLGTVSSVEVRTTTGAAVTRSTFGDIAISNTGMLYGSSTQNVFFSVNLNAAVSAGQINSYTSIRTNAPGSQLSFNDTFTTLYGQSFSGGNWYTINTASGAYSNTIYSSPIVGADGLRDLGGATASASPVPEPSYPRASAFLLLGGGAFAFTGRRMNRKPFAAA